MLSYIQGYLGLKILHVQFRFPVPARFTLLLQNKRERQLMAQLARPAFRDDRTILRKIDRSRQ